MRLKSFTSLNIFVLFSLLIFSLAVSSCSKIKTVSSGGYTYKTVDGDPLKTRINVTKEHE